MKTLQKILSVILLTWGSFFVAENLKTVEAQQQVFSDKNHFEGISDDETIKSGNSLKGKVSHAALSIAHQVKESDEDDVALTRQLDDQKEEQISHSLPQRTAAPSETVSFNFEDVDLASVAKHVEIVHQVKFITDDILDGNKDAKGFSGHKISFRTNVALSKQESWSLFITFLSMAGLDAVPMAQAGFYKIVALPSASQEAVPTYIGVNNELLPDNDMVVRYVYFMKNLDPAKIQQLIGKLQGSSGTVSVYTELKALVFTDKSYNIKSLMKIVSELDRSTLPQVMSVVRLKKANVEDVINLYNSLRPATTSQPKAWSPQHKESSLEYFPQDVVLSGDKRTNTLIILGVKDAVSRIEKFVTKYVDIDANDSVKPVRTYHLEYTNATDVQKMLSQLVQYGSSSPGGQYGGVRDGYKYLQQMTIVADDHSNALIINSTEDDYKVVEELIKKIDVPQKQVAFEVLMVQVKDTDTKQLGSQISGPNSDNSFLKNVSAQTSGVPPGTGIVTNSPTDGVAYSIKSSLASLLSGTVGAAGSTLLTFGSPIWSVFKVLKTIASTKIIANPFMVTTNNAKGYMKIGTSRRVVTGEVVSSGSTAATGYANAEANLEVTIVPQINDMGVINMTIDIKNDQFVNDGANDAVQDNKSITTAATVANGEVLVLGGIMVDTVTGSAHGVPLLSKVPVIGWLFKSKSKKIVKENFVLFISPKILDDVVDRQAIEDYTYKKVEETQEYLKLIEEAEGTEDQRDPIGKAFFGENERFGSKALTTDILSDSGEIINHPQKNKMNKKAAVKKSNKVKVKKSKKKQKKKKKKSEAQVKIDMSEDLEKISHRPVNSITNTLKNNVGGSHD